MVLEVPLPPKGDAVEELVEEIEATEGVEVYVPTLPSDSVAREDGDGDREEYCVAEEVGVLVEHIDAAEEGELD